MRYGNRGNAGSSFSKRVRWMRTTVPSACMPATARSEVEVLHDQLLTMLAQDPSLTPRHHRDGRGYRPLHALYSGGVRQCPAERPLPFAISDRKARQAHPALRAFISLLDLPQSRFTSEQVLALLEVPALAAVSPLAKRGCACCAIGSVNPACAGAWTTITCANWICPLPANIPGALASRMLLGYAMDNNAGDWRGILPYTNRADWSPNWRGSWQTCWRSSATGGKS